VITTIPGDPATESSFTDPEFTCNFNDRPGTVYDELHGFLPELG
jgi:hypothetical protein